MVEAEVRTNLYHGRSPGFGTVAPMKPRSPLFMKPKGQGRRYQMKEPRQCACGRRINRAGADKCWECRTAPEKREWERAHSRKRYDRDFRNNVGSRRGVVLGQVLTDPPKPKTPVCQVCFSLPWRVEGMCCRSCAMPYREEPPPERAPVLSSSMAKCGSW